MILQKTTPLIENKMGLQATTTQFIHLQCGNEDGKQWAKTWVLTLLSVVDASLWSTSLIETAIEDCCPTALLIGAWKLDFLEHVLVCSWVENLIDQVCYFWNTRRSSLEAFLYRCRLHALNTQLCFPINHLVFAL